MSSIIISNIPTPLSFNTHQTTTIDWNKIYHQETEEICVSCRSPNATIVEDFARGDLVCRECGYVQQERIIDEGTDWRTFSNNDGDGGVDPNRIGSAYNPLLDGQSNLSTVIQKKSSSKSVIASGSPSNTSLSRLQQKTSLTAGDKQMMGAYQDIDEICDRMGLSNVTQQTAKELYKLVNESKRQKLKGKQADAMVGACVHTACRAEHATRSFQEICNLSPKKITKKDINKASTQLKSVLDKVHPDSSLYLALHKPSSSYSFAVRFCNDLGLDFESQKLAESMSRRIGELGVTEGRNPISVTAVCMLMVVKLTKQSLVTIETISKASGVESSTIKTIYKILHPYRDQLLPNDSKYLQLVDKLLPSSI